jgi:PadR family transcriptional regulator PadR
MPAKSDLPQGTLDLLIMKIAALGPVDGYAIAQRLQQVSRDVVQVPQDPSIQRCIALKIVAFWLPTGRNPKPDAKPSSIA